MPATPEVPSRLPAGLIVTGDLTSDHDLAIDGTFDGHITLLDKDLIIAKGAKVNAKIVARVVTIAGRVDGTVTATGRVRLEPSASVRAHLQTPSLIMAEGAAFNGTVDPSRTEAAVHVARYRAGAGAGAAGAGGAGGAGAGGVRS